MQQPCVPSSGTDARHFSESSEDGARRLLYHLALVCGLGGGRDIVETILKNSRGAWRVPRRKDGSGINGGGPLEVSLRSDSVNTLRYASCVGLPAMTPMSRLRLGIKVFESNLAKVGADPYLIEPLTAWCEQLDSSLGRFGCYTGGCYHSERTRVKLYIDLFGGAKAGLRNLQELVSMCGYFSAPVMIPERLFDIAIPRLCSLEWSSESKSFDFKLYWRLKNGCSQPQQVCQLLTGSSEFGHLVYDTFQQSGGGFHPEEMPVSGFVHPYPLVEGAIGFYSFAPSRWAGTEKKRQTIMKLWREWGGDAQYLDRVWKLVKGSSQVQSWTPTLTLIGLAERADGKRTMSAYLKTL